MIPLRAPQSGAKKKTSHRGHHKIRPIPSDEINALRVTLKERLLEQWQLNSRMYTAIPTPVHPDFMKDWYNDIVLVGIDPQLHLNTTYMKHMVNILNEHDMENIANMQINDGGAHASDSKETKTGSSSLASSQGQIQSQILEICDATTKKPIPAGLVIAIHIYGNIGETVRIDDIRSLAIAMRNIYASRLILITDNEVKKVTRQRVENSDEEDFRGFKPEFRRTGQIELPILRNGLVPQFRRMTVAEVIVETRKDGIGPNGWDKRKVDQPDIQCYGFDIGDNIYIFRKKNKVPQVAHIIPADPTIPEPIQELFLDATREECNALYELRPTRACLSLDESFQIRSDQPQLTTTATTRKTTRINTSLSS